MRDGSAPPHSLGPTHTPRLGRGQEVDAAKANAAFADQSVGMGPDLASLATQHGDLETMDRIEMRVQGCDTKIMVGMLRHEETFSEIALVMIEHVGHYGDATTIPSHR